MKVKRPQKRQISQAERRGVIVAAWQSLGEPEVGAHELLMIQQVLQELFGNTHMVSPASIARELAQTGAELRHPEIIECDAHWREAEITKQLKRFKGISSLPAEGPLRLNQAQQLIERFEKLRQRLEQAGEDQALAELRALAIEARKRAALHAKDDALSELRDEQAEIAEWLMVWLQTPKLFSEWLDLRKASPAFKKKFTVDPH